MNREESRAAMGNWADYGKERMIYIKPVRVNRQVLHALFAADGTQLLLVEARALAEATIRRHELEPMSVH